MPQFTARATLAAGICVGGFSLLANIAHANDFLPGSRKALLTAFSGDLFPDAMASVTDTIKPWFVARGYQVTTMARTALNPVNPATPDDGLGYYTVDDFKRHRS